MDRATDSRYVAAAGYAAVSVLAMIAMALSGPTSATAPPGDGAPRILTTKTDTTTNHTGPGSLRAAIFKVNNPAVALGQDRPQPPRRWSARSTR